MEILFRGLTHDNTWVFGLLRKQREKEVKSNMVAYTGNWDYYIDSHDGSIGSWLVNPETVGMFTNGIDYKNNQIYDGDLIKNPDTNNVYEVHFDERRLGFYGKDIEDDSFNYPLHELIGNLCYLIGNIHQNNDNKSIE